MSGPVKLPDSLHVFHKKHRLALNEREPNLKSKLLAQLSQTPGQTLRASLVLLCDGFLLVGAGLFQGGKLPW